MAKQPDPYADCVHPSRSIESGAGLHKNGKPLPIRLTPRDQRCHTATRQHPAAETHEVIPSTVALTKDPGNPRQLPVIPIPPKPRKAPEIVLRAISSN